MKYLLAALSGFALTLCVFLGGAAFAITYLTAEPLAVERPMATFTPSFPSQAVKVDAAEQAKEFDRIESPPLPSPIEPAVETQEIEETNPEQGIDSIITEALPGMEVHEPTLGSAHLAWCSDRYRSYRPETNSYMSYSGETRECVSPYEGNRSEEGVAIEASANAASYTSSGGLSQEHIDSCFARYRSYTPEDNTYQPYTGGPRRQCD